MATNATYNPTGTTRPADKPTGPFGEQGQRPDTLGAPREGQLAKRIEQETAQWPSDTFLWAALGAVGASLMLRTANQKQASLFVGQWVSPLLLFGVYNKLVKLGGSDKFSR